MKQFSNQATISEILVQDASGVTIGDNNTIYQYFFSETKYRSLLSKIYSFTTLIEDKTKEFVGRKFVFDAIDQFISEHDNGYFVIEGDPGIGKTALAAELVRSRGYLHHFVMRSQGISGPEEFLQNICAQLIARYKLGKQFVAFAINRPSLGNLSAALGEILGLVSRSLEPNDRCVIIVDALDEADVDRPGQNILLLPTHLPKGIIFIVTRRRKPMGLYIDGPLSIFNIPSTVGENLNDIRSWLDSKMTSPNLEMALGSTGLTPDAFASLIVDKSEGNFMYVRHIMSDLEKRRNSTPTLQWYQELPQGLVAYYDRHWQQIRGDLSLVDWTTFYESTICVLAVAREPLAARQIATIVKVEVGIVNGLLEDFWLEFLHREVIQELPHYRIYHTTFQEYLENKVDLSRYHGMIADYLDNLYIQRKSDAISYAKSHNPNAFAKVMAHLAGAIRRPSSWKKLFTKIMGNG